MSEDIRREPDSDADDLARRRVDDWGDVSFIMTGTNESVDGDGLTQTATSLQPGENAVLEVVHDGETIARFVPAGDKRNVRYVDTETQHHGGDER